MSTRWARSDGVQGVGPNPRCSKHSLSARIFWDLESQVAPWPATPFSTPKSIYLSALLENDDTVWYPVFGFLRHRKTGYHTMISVFLVLMFYSCLVFALLHPTALHSKIHTPSPPNMRDVFVYQGRAYMKKCFSNLQ